VVKSYNFSIDHTREERKLQMNEYDKILLVPYENSMQDLLKQYVAV